MQEVTTLKKIAVINDISGFGKCSLTVSLPIISALGIECNPIPTAILSNQTGYDDFYSVDFTENMTPYIDIWKKQNVHFDAILTGYLASEKQVDVILDFIENFKDENTLVFVDPVMADDGVMYDTYDENLCEKVKKPYGDNIHHNHSPIVCSRSRALNSLCVAEPTCP